ncbi:purple acid phosphatase family protein [Halomarina halobia]|uniref:Purple acid phosphatase family protein n=1 Tax=Halomarina halobia TaxID=3033386 RepID=A0ABD6A6F9_9EURY|nr:metallophosphoesterase family protein [Halomarina sp. PSR21]
MSDGGSGGGDDGFDRRDLLRGVATVAAGSLAPAFPTSAGVARGAIGGAPTGVHVAYGPDPQRSASVGWTAGGTFDARVEYGERGGDLSAAVEANATVLPGEDLVAYDATIEGLTPDTAYDYRAVVGDERSATFAFRTAPEDGTDFRVSMVADHGIADDRNPAQRADDDGPVRIVDRAREFDPAFHLGVGDIAYANGFPYTWDEYFRAFEDFYATTPFLTVPGNHEKEPGQGFAQYDGRLNRLMPFRDPGLPDLGSKRRWYDFRYGNALFVGLNTSADACGDLARGEEFLPFQDTRCYTDESYLYNERQRAYVEETLEDARDDPAVTWTVVYFHSSLWTDGDHAAREDLRDLWGPLFDEYGVDLVLAGHNHSYERSKPIVGETAGEVGTTYVVNGTGGSGHYGFRHDEPPEWTAFRDSDRYGIVRLSFSERRIEGEYVALDGTVVDSFALAKTADGEPTQLRPGDATREPLAVDGTRSDDGSTWHGGRTNRIRLTASADRPIRLRDRVPAEWTVTGTGDSGPEYVDADGAPDGYQHVYFDVPPTSDADVVYYAEAPEGPGATGEYEFGPAQAREVNGSGWVDVEGTASTERVVGAL